MENPANKHSKNIKILVLGLGNILLKDEGAGVHIIRKLGKLALPDYVEIIDGGTASLDVLLLAQNISKLVVIDAATKNGKPGSIYKFRLKHSVYPQFTDFRRLSSVRLSLHQVNLIDALTAAQKLGVLPEEMVIIGVEPEEIDYGLELTNKVRKAVPKVINIVLKEIEDVIYTK